MHIAALLVEFDLCQEGLFESELRNHLARAAHLPFSDDGGRITGLLSHMGKGSLVVIHITEAYIVLVIVHSCHDLNTARAAERQ